MEGEQNLSRIKYATSQRVMAQTFMYLKTASNI